MNKLKLIPIFSVIILIILTFAGFYYSNLNMQDIDKAIDVSDIKYNSTNNYGYITVNFLATLNSSRPMKVLYNEYIVYDEQGIELERASGSQITDIKAGAPTKMHYSYYADEARGKPYKLVITTHLDKNRILWNKEIIL